MEYELRMELQAYIFVHGSWYEICRRFFPELIAVTSHGNWLRGGAQIFLSFTTHKNYKSRVSCALLKLNEQRCHALLPYVKFDTPFFNTNWRHFLILMKIAQYIMDI
jgi:hypothetical protein